MSETLHRHDYWLLRPFSKFVLSVPRSTSDSIPFDPSHNTASQQNNWPAVLESLWFALSAPLTAPRSSSYPPWSPGHTDALKTCCDRQVHLMVYTVKRKNIVKSCQIIKSPCTTACMCLHDPPTTKQAPLNTWSRIDCSSSNGASWLRIDGTSLET